MGGAGDKDRPRLASGTIAVHGGLGERGQGAPFLAGPTFAAPFHVQGDDPLAAADYVYGRYGNPTWTNLEDALSELEDDDSRTLIFPSGSAAISAVLMATVEQGKAIVVPNDGYPAARLTGGWLADMGVEVRKVPTDTEAVIAALPGAALVFVETPSNPGLDVADIGAVSAAAAAEGARLVVDNTVATPLGQRPLEHGAHGSLMSASKHLTGHNDLVLGSFTSRDGPWMDSIEKWRRESGSIVGPFEAWLAHRSLATLEVRLDRQCGNAVSLAEMLSGREDVPSVRYLGLASDPAHELAARQMTRFGSIICFDLEDADRARRFLSACELIIEASSFGGVHTSAERKARWGIDLVSSGLIRLSVGIEDPVDLRADLEQALDRAG
ncbi:MAG TPA: cystathionine gamma-lyase [Solirubrobacterales bacterium]|nr:cystathionine gamma-lyase [Solirubrobacterales bacterium]